MLDQYNTYIQQQVASIRRLQDQTIQAGFNNQIASINEFKTRINAIQTFNDLLASQKVAFDFSQKISDINLAKAEQNVQALTKEAQVNSNLINRAGSAQQGEVQAVAARSNVVSNKGTINTLTNQIRNETIRAGSNNERESLTKINSALDQVTSMTIEQAIAGWDLETQQDFMKKSFIASL